MNGSDGMTRRGIAAVFITCCLLLMVAGVGIGYLVNSEKQTKNNITNNQAQNVNELESQDTYHGDSTKSQVNDNPIHEGGEGEAVLDEETTEPVNALLDQKKIDENTKLIFKNKYLKCGHESAEEVELPNSLINLTVRELSAFYPERKVESFESNVVILSTEIIDKKCPKHYILKEYNGKLGVFYQYPPHDSELHQIIDMNVEHFRQEDRGKLKNGIEINSDEELAQILEDFTS